MVQENTNTHKRKLYKKIEPRKNNNLELIENNFLIK